MAVRGSCRPGGAEEGTALLGMTMDEFEGRKAEPPSPGKAAPSPPEQGKGLRALVRHGEQLWIQRSVQTRPAVLPGMLEGPRGPVPTGSG